MRLPKYKKMPSNHKILLQLMNFMSDAIDEYCKMQNVEAKIDFKTIDSNLLEVTVDLGHEEEPPEFDE